MQALCVFLREVLGMKPCANLVQPECLCKPCANTNSPRILCKLVQIYQYRLCACICIWFGRDTSRITDNAAHGDGRVKKHICPTPIRIHIATLAFLPACWRNLDGQF